MSFALVLSALASSNTTHILVHFGQGHVSAVCSIPKSHAKPNQTSFFFFLTGRCNCLLAYHRHCTVGQSPVGIAHTALATTIWRSFRPQTDRATPLARSWLICMPQLKITIRSTSASPNYLIKSTWCSLLPKVSAIWLVMICLCPTIYLSHRIMCVLE